ncbi:MAG TPA: amidohydrolase family protein, partial [Steroidobacteraceae bacterium]|nr:amidohydrolase family protein [Steroidobacteraceae bacterium]
VLAVTAHAETTAVVAAKAYTLTSPGAIENATIVIRDGRIVSVVAGGVPPAGARVVDAQGRIVTPGLMSAGTQLGLIEVDSTAADATVSSGALGAAFDVQYALDPNSTSLALARADGLTRAVTFPSQSADAPFNGIGAVLRLEEGPKILDVPRAGMFATTGGMSAASAGGSRGAQWLLLRNALDEAKRCAAAPAQCRNAGQGEQLVNRLNREALGAVVQGTMPLAITAARESDIRQAIRLAGDYGIRVFVYGGAEAWRAAADLAARRIPVVLDPFANTPATFDEIGARADNAAILHRAGVTIAFAVPGISMTHNAGSIVREAAGLAVANGLPWDEALRALTVNPARIWGVDQRYGSLAPGKEADLVIWDGDPLEPSSAPVVVLVAGREVPLTSRQTELRDRYSPRRATDPLPPPFR